MRILCFASMLCGPAAGFAQIAATGTGGVVGGIPGGIPPTPGLIAANPTLRSDPPSSGLALRFDQAVRGVGSVAGDPSFYSRSVLDRVNHVVLGYELVLVEQQPGTFLATFGKLGLTPLEISTRTAPRPPPNVPASAARPVSPLNSTNWKEWKSQPPPTIPEPRLVHPGDTISVELLVDAVTGEKLIDDIRIQPQRTVQPTLTAGALPNVVGPTGRATPTVSGTPHDFTAADAELQLAQPRVTLNGTSQSTAGRVSPNVHGPLVWLYLPEHGRFVLSLAPRPELDFKPAGEARGGAITLTVGVDSIKVECPNPVAGGNAPYNLYVLHDPQWEPTAQAQKGQFATGSVDPGELAALIRT